jgi:hypothetical protein
MKLLRSGCSKRNSANPPVVERLGAVAVQPAIWRSADGDVEPLGRKKRDPVRKLLILPIFLVMAAYAGWPAWSAWQLRSAIKARNLTGIESRVDWPTLRSNLKQAIAVYLEDESPGDGVLSNLKRMLVPFAAGQMVEIAVTPRTLALVLAGDLAGSATKSNTANGSENDAAVDVINDQLSLRRLRWASFETPTRFRIEATAQRDPTKRVVSILALEGASWKLVDVYYRTP